MPDETGPQPAPGSTLLGVSTFFAVIVGGAVGGVMQADRSEGGSFGAGGFFAGALITLLFMLPFWALFRLGSAILSDLRGQRGDAN